MLDLRDHGPNICIEIGVPANRRRAEGYLYVLETAFTVQGTLCTSKGQGQTVQKGRPRPVVPPKLGTNSLKFKLMLKWAVKSPRRRIWSSEAKVRPQYTYRVRLIRSGRRFGGEGAQGGGG